MKENTRIVFMGTPEFAVESLKQLVENKYNIVGVITSPDKPAGRGQKISQSAVKTYALSQNLKVLQPEKLKNPEFINELKELKADLQIVVAFRMLPESVWSMPPLGTFNLHASLLPQYRGAAPINWAIINGEEKTGLTTFFLDKEIDTGRIIDSTEVSIEKNDNAGSLHDKLMVEGARLLIDTTEKIINKAVRPIDQKEIIKGKLNHAPKIFKEDCKINWDKDVDQVYNFIRGLSPYPTAWTEISSTSTGKRISLKLFDAEKIHQPHTDPVGSITTNKAQGIFIAVKNGYIRLETIQPASKKKMKAQDWLRGFGDIESYKCL